MSPARIMAAALACLALSPCAASARGDPATAALQVALARVGLYRGTIDGVADPRTRRAVRRLQVLHGLAVDGIVGPRTRAALGRFGTRRLGSRLLRRGEVGSDVAELQFELAWAGFPSGVLDGRFGPHLESAVRRFQRTRGLAVDGVAGAATLAAVREPPHVPPTALARPVEGAVGDRFGPRGDRFHAGVDLLAPAGAPVVAAAAGRVVWAAPRAAWGLLVSVAHRDGIRTLYAHLESIAVRLGARVEAGTLLGRVGATGDATGPHLHFEVRADGAAVDPLPLLGYGTASKNASSSSIARR